MKRIYVLRSWILKLFEMIRACCGSDRQPLDGIPDDPHDPASNPVPSQLIETMRIELELERGNVIDELERDFCTLVKANERKPENRSNYYAIVQSLRFILRRAMVQQDKAIEAEYARRGLKPPAGRNVEELIRDLAPSKALQQDVQRLAEQYRELTLDSFYVLELKKEPTGSILFKLKGEIKNAIAQYHTNYAIQLKHEQGGLILADDPKLVAKLTGLVAEKEEVKPVEAMIKSPPKSAFNYAEFAARVEAEAGTCVKPERVQPLATQIDQINREFGARPLPPKPGKNQNKKGDHKKGKPKHQAVA